MVVLNARFAARCFLYTSILSSGAWFDTSIHAQDANNSDVLDLNDWKTLVYSKYPKIKIPMDEYHEALKSNDLSKIRIALHTVLSDSMGASRQARKSPSEIETILVTTAIRIEGLSELKDWLIKRGLDRPFDDHAEVMQIQEMLVQGVEGVWNSDERASDVENLLSWGRIADYNKALRNASAENLVWFSRLSFLNGDQWDRSFTVLESQEGRALSAPEISLANRIALSAVLSSYPTLTSEQVKRAQKQLSHYEHSLVEQAKRSLLTRELRIQIEPTPLFPEPAKGVAVIDDSPYGKSLKFTDGLKIDFPNTAISSFKTADSKSKAVQKTIAYAFQTAKGDLLLVDSVSGEYQVVRKSEIEALRALINSQPGTLAIGGVAGRTLLKTVGEIPTGVVSLLADFAQGIGRNCKTVWTKGELTPITTENYEAVRSSYEAWVKTDFNEYNRREGAADVLLTKYPEKFRDQILKTAKDSKYQN